MCELWRLAGAHFHILPLLSCVASCRSPSVSFHFLVRETGMGRGHEAWVGSG